MRRRTPGLALLVLFLFPPGGILKDTEHPNQAGFYLVTLKGSQQAGLTGLKGGIVRKVAVDKTRSSLEKALASVKQKTGVSSRIAQSRSEKYGFPRYC